MALVRVLSGGPQSKVPIQTMTALAYVRSQIGFWRPPLRAWTLLCSRGTTCYFAWGQFRTMKN